MLRDPIACKPAVMAETDDWVAMASEYRAIAVLPGAEDARVWEPEPATVYYWERRRSEWRDARPTPARRDRRPRDDARCASSTSACTTSARRGARLARRQPAAAATRSPSALDADVEVDVDGHVGYYCAGMNQHATVRVHGNGGVGVAENIMSGTVSSRATPASRPARPAAAACSSSTATRPRAAGSR